MGDSLMQQAVTDRSVQLASLSAIANATQDLTAQVRGNTMLSRMRLTIGARSFKATLLFSSSMMRMAWWTLRSDSAIWLNGSACNIRSSACLSNSILDWSALGREDCKHKLFNCLPLLSQQWGDLLVFLTHKESSKVCYSRMIQPDHFFSWQMGNNGFLRLTERSLQKGQPVRRQKVPFPVL